MSACQFGGCCSENVHKGSEEDNNVGLNILWIFLQVNASFLLVSDCLRFENSIQFKFVGDWKSVLISVLTDNLFWGVLPWPQQQCQSLIKSNHYNDKDHSKLNESHNGRLCDKPNQLWFCFFDSVQLWCSCIGCRSWENKTCPDHVSHFFSSEVRHKNFVCFDQFLV